MEKDRRLEDARKEIDRIDQQMASLFEERMKQAEKVAAYKSDYGLAILDTRREEDLVKQRLTALTRPELAGYYADFLRQTMRISKSYQTELMEGMKVAYSGIEGAYAYVACQKLFPSAESLAYPDFKAAYDAVVDNRAQVAVLPLENSSAGEVGQVTDLIFSGPLSINNTFELTISHDLLAPPGADLTTIKRVMSHPQALSQCSDFLRDRGYDQIPCENTAIAAAKVADQNDPELAAIASGETADLYGLQAVAKGINSSANNTTRFAVLSAKSSVDSDNRGQEHFILMFTVKNVAGSLARALNIIGSYDFNLRVLRSRPMKKLLWQYYFYAEAEGNIHSTAGNDMMEALRVCCDHLKLVGVF